jgi:rSAM/selenodomain-associated transferase 2
MEPDSSHRFSIIIPTLNEEGVIASCLEALPENDDRFEIIVVDGGSTDRTREIVSEFGYVYWLNSPAGRGGQQNTGGRFASGEILLFLHADTYLPEGAFEKIEKALARCSVMAGSFRLEFQPGSPILRFFGWMSGWNFSLTTYGDQAFFTRRSIFRSCGGFLDLPICEDVEFQSRLRRRGRWIKLKDPVITSSRRFKQNGPVRQQFKNILIVGCFLAGVDAIRLYRWYFGREPAKPAIPRKAIQNPVR